MRIELPFKRLTFRQKLIITSIACLVLPTIGMILSTNHYSKLIIREHTLDKAKQSLLMVQSQIDAILTEMVSVANFVHFDPEIKNLLEEAKTNPVASRQLTTRLEQVAGETRDLRITLLDNDGRAYSDYSFYDFDPVEFKSRDWFARLDLLSGYDTLFAGGEANYLASERADLPYVFIAARALRESNSKPPFAYLIVSRTEAAIRDRFQELEEDVFVLGADHTILSNRDPQQIGSSLESILPIADLRSTAILRVGDANQLFISLPLAFGDWSLVSLAPYEQLTGRLNGLSRSGLIIQSVFAIVFLMALTYLLRRFTRPIQTLGKAARQIEAGNLTIRSNIRGNDEVGSLGRSFDHMLDRIEQTMQEFRTEQELKRRAEIAMLQAQLHPHFLFNVLTSIRMRLLLQKDEDNAKLLAALAALLRSSFTRHGEFVTLGQEIESAKQYIELMRFAMRHPTTYEMDVDPKLLDATVPRLILQPIIENAYKHGFARKGGCVVIQIKTRDNKLILTVKNNGAPLSSQTIAELEQRLACQPHEYGADKTDNMGSGIGLYNVSTRLKLIYGDDFQMSIQYIEPEWSAITLVFPMHTGGEGGGLHV